MTLSNRFLEINGVYPVKPKPAPKPSNRFLEINGVYPTSPPKPTTAPAPVSPPRVQAQTASNTLFNSLLTSQPAPIAPPWPTPKPAPPVNNYFLEINGALQTPKPTPSPIAPFNYGSDPEGLVPLRTAPSPAPTVAAPPSKPQPTPEAIAKAETRIATEILAGRDADRLHLINPETGHEYTDDEISEINQRLETQKADRRIAREIVAGRDADKLHLIDPSTGSEYTDAAISQIAAEIDAAQQQRADGRIAIEIIEGRDADKLHLINPETGQEYTDAEIGEIAGAVVDFDEQNKLAADARVAREIAAGRDADRMHFINPETGQEYTDAEIDDISRQLDDYEKAQADARIANEVFEGRDADKLHLVNPATGQEYTDQEIGEITEIVRAEQREIVTPQFKEEVDKLVEDGTDRDVAVQLTAFAFVQSGVPASALPGGVEAFDPNDVFVEEHDQFDTGRDVSRGENGRIDGFVSLQDLSSIIDNPDNFDPRVVATAMMIQDHVSAPGNEALREQFVKKGWIDTIKESEWLNPNSDSIIVNVARMGTGQAPSPAFIQRVKEDGPGELRDIGNSLVEISRFLNPVQDIAMTGYEIFTADDPMAALRAAPREYLDDRIAFGQGVWDWTKGTAELGVGLWALSNPVNAYLLEETTGVNVYDEVGYAAEGLARGFLTDPDELARNIVGYDMFIDDPIRWAGQQAPEILIDVFTGGAGKFGRVGTVVGAASDASRLGQRTLFDADAFLDVPGQQRLLDADYYFEAPGPVVSPARGEIPNQLSLFDETTNPLTPNQIPGQRSLFAEVAPDGSISAREVLGREFFDEDLASGIYGDDIPVNPAARPGGVSLFPWMSSDLPTSGLKGMNLEGAVHNTLHGEGYNVFSLTNKSGHGTDIIAVKPGNPSDIFVIEVKANSSQLSNLQQLGGPAHLENVIGRARNQNTWNIDDFDQFLTDNGIVKADLVDNGSFLIARQKGIEADGLITDSSIIEVAEWTPGTTGTTSGGQRRDWGTLDSLSYPPISQSGG